MMTLIPIQNGTRGRRQELKLAVLRAFCLRRTELLQRAAVFDWAEWEKMLVWLDMSGLALYLLDHMWSEGAEHLLPAHVEAQLQRRLQLNRLRTQAMTKNAVLLAKWFDDSGMTYAMLKGFTLVPHAVPDSSLRWQADLDFLIAEKHAELATHYAARLGYRLYARSGSTLEFRTGSASFPDLSRMYSPETQSALELHLADQGSAATSHLERRQMREMESGAMFSLCPADILVQQALHLLKHLTGEHTRASWVLEFWRHIQARRSEQAFWSQVETISAGERNGDLAMAIAFWLSDAVFGPVERALPRQWRAESLPERVRLWLELYGVGVLLSESTGSKVYALLKQELPHGSPDRRSLRQVLIPFRLPRPLWQRPYGETLGDGWRRYLVELYYVAHRCCFHFVEGIRFGIQAARWRRAVARCSR